MSVALGARAGSPAGLAARPLLIAVLAMLGYLVLLWPTLAKHDGDLSTFIVAGDRYVDAAATASPILVRPHSDGYDGQFYYRLAVHPFSFAARDQGVAFDSPAWRMQRIGYPLLAWTVSLGHAAAVPAVLFAINLLGLGAIAGLAAAIARKAALSPFVPLAIVLWPGFLAGLTHDTTEITAEMLLLGAILCRAHGRLLPYAALAAFAALTRESSVLIPVGFLLHDAWRAWQRRALSPAVVAGALLLVPFFAWREIVTLGWHANPQAAALQKDIGLPFVGLADMLLDCLGGARQWNAANMVQDGLIRAVILVTIPVLLGFCVLAAGRVRPALRSRMTPDILPGLAVAWVLLALLMSLLVAGWVDPTGYFRLFSECYVVGCLLLGAGPPIARRLLGVGLVGLLVSWFSVLVLI